MEELCSTHISAGDQRGTHFLKSLCKEFLFKQFLPSAGHWYIG